MCPRECGANRLVSRGFCGADAHVRVAKSMLHQWEEPCICAGGGAGAIFFTGCPLGCVYCQNAAINRGGGDICEGDALAALMESLVVRGACCIDLVSPTQYSRQLLTPLRKFKAKLPDVPVVWNTGGYDSVGTLALLEGVVDIYLTDFKYASPGLAAKYSRAADYPDVAAAALGEMCRQLPRCEFDGAVMRRGVIVRHLVLPNCRRDSMAVLERVRAVAGTANVRLSLMSQYTPDFAPDSCPELGRRLTTFEYRSVLDYADALGFDGWMQGKSSATANFTPDFEVNG